MLVPISWLKEYVEVKLPLKDLMWKMTEAGLTCESYKKVDGEIILDIEVTPNRPDMMSIVGVTREVAAITNTKIKINYPAVKTKNITNPLNITIKPNYKVVPRITSVIIKDVKVKPSPSWLQKRIIQVGLRPINNLVDITNYVLWTHGSLLHVFDYDKIKGHIMKVELSKGGESFRSLDGLDYSLPKNAIIIKDSDQIIDLLPLKGGENTASNKDTKNVLLHSIVCDPVITRRTSQALKLRSDSSVIAERGLDPNGTTIAVNHALSLILELAGGQVASEIIDHKARDFPPGKLSLNLPRLEKILGLTVPTKKVTEILTNLNLSPKLKDSKIDCTIPTYRGDLKLEEDLIEEVARIYGYNKFPKTLPKTDVTTKNIPYYNDYKFIIKLKEMFVASGYSEAMTLSLISKDLIKAMYMDPEKHIKLSNPVSSDYEYMRTSLVPSLFSALKLNKDSSLKIFELNKVFLGVPGKTTEPYKISGLTKDVEFREFKGVLDLLFDRLNIKKHKIVFESGSIYWHPSKSGTIMINNHILGNFGEIHPSILAASNINTTVSAFELDVDVLQNSKNATKFITIPDFPPQIEDLTLSFNPKTKIGEVIRVIKETSKDISSVELKGIFSEFYTFRIWYQSTAGTLSNLEVEKIRNEVIKNLKSAFGATVK